MYPLAGERLHLVDETPWVVHEPGPDDDALGLVALADAITERLAKAEALTRLLQTDDVPDASLPNAAWAIADLIGEARELYVRQWALIRAQCGGGGD